MLNQEQIDAVKAKHAGKDLHLVTVNLDDQELEFVCVSPGKAQISKYLQEVSDAGQEFRAAENFVLSCTVHPERKELQAMFDKHPLIITTLNKDLEKKAGFGAKSTSKKL